MGPRKARRVSPLLPRLPNPVSVRATLVRGRGQRRTQTARPVWRTGSWEPGYGCRRTRVSDMEREGLEPGLTATPLRARDQAPCKPLRETRRLPGNPRGLSAGTPAARRLSPALWCGGRILPATTSGEKMSRRLAACPTSHWPVAPVQPRGARSRPGPRAASGSRGPAAFPGPAPPLAAGHACADTSRPLLWAPTSQGFGELAVEDRVQGDVT